MKFLLWKKTQKIPATSKKVPSQPVAKSEFLIHTIYISQVLAEIKTRKRFFIDDISFTDNIKYKPAISLPVEKHCINFESYPPMREHLESYLCFIHLTVL